MQVRFVMPGLVLQKRLSVRFEALYQGTTLVVPHSSKKMWALARAQFA
jgi:hypothetical protein